jgi:ATP-dependent RNA helicase RhlE
MVDKVSKKLNQSGIRYDRLYGNKTQNYRIQALDNFKSGHMKVLVAKDVVAKGIDVYNISKGINYQLPMPFNRYLNRIGRMGCAGAIGKTLTFADEDMNDWNNRKNGKR